MRSRTQDEGDPRPKIPLGVPSIDNRLHGGVRPGTSILAMGPYGTGYHEFLRTAAVMHGNWQAESGLFELEYGSVPETVRQPSQVRYILINDTETAFRRHIHDIADDDVAYPALENITVTSIASEVAEVGAITPSEEGGFRYKSEAERTSSEYEEVFERFDDLIEGEPDEFVIVDSITDFGPLTEKFLDPVDIYFLAQTLCHVVSESGSVLLAGGDGEVLGQKRRALLKRSFESVLSFDWFGEGMRKRRTMSVSKFPEFWREVGADERVTFDLDIDREHFGISKISKIP